MAKFCETKKIAFVNSFEANQWDSLSFLAVRLPPEQFAFRSFTVHGRFLCVSLAV